MSEKDKQKNEDVLKDLNRILLMIFPEKTKQEVA